MTTSHVFEGFFSVFKPEPVLSVSDWADEYRMLPQIAAAEPGRWRTERTPYLRDIMNDLSPSSPVEEVIFMKGAQIGASESGNNWIGYVIDRAPGPMLVVQPTVDIAKRYSQQRIAPMINECTSLKEKVGDAKSRDSANTQMSKEFPGGVLLLAGANSAAGLRSMPIRYLMLDETDAYPPDCDGEGSPIDLAVARTRTFSRRKIYKVSTPTIKGVSHIEAEFERTDQRRYFVPCPHCGEMDYLRWDRLVIPKDADGKKQPHKAFMVCTACGGCIEDHHKTDILSRGEWRPTNTENTSRKRRGYHLSSLYSPVGWYSWTDAAGQWLEAQGNPEKLKAFVNTVLGETWEEQGERVSDHELAQRAENYDAEPLPVGAVLLTAGTDVQPDRLVTEIVAWGRGEESWSIDFIETYGNPDLDDVWHIHDATVLNRVYNTTSGMQLRVARCCVDTGGANTAAVYEQVKARQAFGVLLGTKGMPGEGKPIIGNPSRTNLAKIPLFPIGTFAAKDLVVGRLKIAEPGPGYCHFPTRHRPGYFQELTAEEVRTKYNKGFPTREWVKIRPRNEALDCRVLATAALASLNVRVDELVAAMEAGAPPSQRRLRGTMEAA
jgi:phage terminase large subunit GpA-like protein